jgi:ATP-dependent RNA helicase RhlE
MDHMRRGNLKLDKLKTLVLDEADEMLRMGFIDDVEWVLEQIPKQRQIVLFSATMPNEIARLSGQILSDPVRVEVTPQATPIERIEQSVYHVPAAGKNALLAQILGDPALSRVIVFARTKHRANKVAEQLGKCGVVAEAIHGNKSQGARQNALKKFRAGEARVLVATDIAARGIDIDSVSHIINYELPNEPESYVHRIGRTARAGAGGTALSFCDPAERGYLRDIERLIRRQLTVIGGAPAAVASDGRGKAGKPRSGKPGGKPWHKRGRPHTKPANDSSKAGRRRRRAA